MKFLSGLKTKASLAFCYLSWPPFIPQNQSPALPAGIPSSVKKVVNLLKNVQELVYEPYSVQLSISKEKGLKLQHDFLDQRINVVETQAC